MEPINTLNVTIQDRNVLYATYMPFIKDGGLFVPTNMSFIKEGNYFVPAKRGFNMGAKVKVIVKLPESIDKYEIMTEIVWITPQGSQNNKVPGIGVRFIGSDAKLLKTKIESLIAPLLKSEKQTHTI